MSEFTIRTRKFKHNALLCRKQFVLDIIHPNLANVSKYDLATKLASMYKVRDLQCIQLIGIKTAFGGGRSTGFGLIYDSVEKMKKFEPKYRMTRAATWSQIPRSTYRLVRFTKITPNKVGRRAKKDAKNRMKKARGREKRKR